MPPNAMLEFSDEIDVVAPAATFAAPVNATAFLTSYATVPVSTINAPVAVKLPAVTFVLPTMLSPDAAAPATSDACVMLPATEIKSSDVIVGALITALPPDTVSIAIFNFSAEIFSFRFDSIAPAVIESAATKFNVPVLSIWPMVRSDALLILALPLLANAPISMVAPLIVNVPPLLVWPPILAVSPASILTVPLVANAPSIVKSWCDVNVNVLPLAIVALSKDTPPTLVSMVYSLPLITIPAIPHVGVASLNNNSPPTLISPVVAVNDFPDKTIKPFVVPRFVSDATFEFAAAISSHAPLVADAAPATFSVWPAARDASAEPNIKRWFAFVANASPPMSINDASIRTVRAVVSVTRTSPPILIMPLFDFNTNAVVPSAATDMSPAFAAALPLAIKLPSICTEFSTVRFLTALRKLNLPPDTIILSRI